MSVMSAEEKQRDGDAEEELFGRRVLSSIVDLLPHVEVVKGAAVEVKGNAADMMEHEI